MKLARLWDGLGLQLRLIILLQGTLIVVLVAAQQWIMHQFEHQVMTTAQERAEAVADGVVNGLNILMIIKNGQNEIISDHKNRRTFVEKSAASEGVKEIRVIRGKGIDDEFDAADLPESRPKDALDQRVLATGKMESQLSDRGDASLRTVVPFIARKNFRSINCLMCHGVDEGATVGAASVTMDIKEELADIQQINLWLWAGQIGLQLVLFLGVRMIVRRLLDQLGGEPVSVIEALRRIARGDLSGQIQVRPGDQHSLLATTRQMQGDLSNVVADIQSAVEAAAAGDFNRRTDLSGKQGFGLDISRALNNLSSNLQSQVGGNPATAVTVARDIAQGDLSSSIDIRSGDNESILAAMASMQRNLNEVISEIRSVVNGASEGDFSGRMNTDAQHGYSLTLAELLNRLSAVTETGLTDVIRVAEAIAQGDLTQTIRQNYPGLFGQLTDAVNVTVTQLREMVGVISEATSAIDVATKEIAQGNQDLSRRVEEQASNLQETAASVEQLNRTVQQNAEHARDANALAKSSLVVATQGGVVVNQVIENMAQIQSSSKRIADIVTMIDSIAFQTNILALNAAVEAARAGEQGRGFAVVATEVRNLAQRSATAAREIKSLIADSVDQVDAGVNLVQQAGATMTEVVSSFEQVAGLVTDVTQASKEQSLGIDQLTTAISRMDQVTQQNAALVQQAAAAAESLEDQAEQLVRAMASFKLDDRSKYLTHMKTVPAS